MGAPVVLGIGFGRVAGLGSVRGAGLIGMGLGIGLVTGIVALSFNSLTSPAVCRVLSETATTFVRLLVVKGLKDISKA